MLSTLTFQGGLGNQMFQWAYGQALREAGLNLAADTVRCRGNRPLVIDGLLADWPRVSRTAGLALVARQRLGESTGIRSDRAFVIESNAGYDPELDAAARVEGRHIVGYFQSPTYFESDDQNVRVRLLDFVGQSLTAKGRTLAQELATSDDAVGVHVRRGDYVSQAKAASAHGALPEDYYRAALSRTDSLGLRRMWFSDDPAWVRKHLAADGDALCTDDLTTGAAGEIALLAACSARIIANSSFSWWGGYLGGRSTEHRPVIAPKRWFLDGRVANQHLPTEWETL